MNKLKSNVSFRLMSFALKLRDLFMSPKNIMKDVEIKPGFHVLDYGCGPEAYSIIAAELTGKSGKVYALDIHPLAIQKVQHIASKKQLANIETICSDCKTDLSDKILDIVFLLDTFHTLSNSKGVLEELHRVLKPDGVLFFSDHHLKENEIISKVADSGLFKLLKKGKRTYTFLKQM